MMYSHLQFQVSQLRQRNAVLGIMSLSVFALALFTSAYLPQLIFQFFYADKQLLQEPMIFTYLPVATFALGVAFFVYTAASIIMNAKKATNLEQQIESLTLDTCGCCDCDSCGDCCNPQDWSTMSDVELEEAAAIVDEVLAAKQPKKRAAKKKAAAKK